MQRSQDVEFILNEECKQTDQRSIEMIRKEDPRFSTKHDPLKPTKTKKVLENKYQAGSDSLVDNADSDSFQFDNQSDTT